MRYNAKCQRVKNIRNRRILKKYPKGVMCEVDFSCELGLAGGGNIAISSLKKASKRDCMFTCGAVEVSFEEISKQDFIKYPCFSAYDKGVGVCVDSKKWDLYKKGNIHYIRLMPYFKPLKSKSKKRSLKVIYLSVKYSRTLVEESDYE